MSPAAANDVKKDNHSSSPQINQMTASAYHMQIHLAHSRNNLATSTIKPAALKKSSEMHHLSNNSTRALSVYNIQQPLWSKEDLPIDFVFWLSTCYREVKYDGPLFPKFKSPLSETATQSIVWHRDFILLHSGNQLNIPLWMMRHPMHHQGSH